MSATTSYYTSSPAVLQAFQEARRTLGDAFVDQSMRAAELGLQPLLYCVLDDSGPSRKLVLSFPDTLPRYPDGRFLDHHPQQLKRAS